MAQMKRFTRSEARAIRSEINEALRAVADKYDAEIDLGNIKFGTSLELKISLSKMTENMFGAYAQTKEAVAFEQNKYKHKIPLEALNQTFKHRGDDITITGYNTRASRYPVNYKRGNKAYKASPTYVLNMIKESLPSVLL